ncbi:MAG: transposase [Armatimonadota bacterium]|nr:transposase [Armatimonadota bacterium]
MTEDESGGGTPQRVIRQFQKRKRTLPIWESPDVTYHVRATVLKGRRERLVQPEYGKVVCDALRHDDGRRYVLHCYVLMPDHVHLMLHPLPRDRGSIPLPEILRMLKGVSARRINSLSGVGGPFWLPESYTRIIRCPDEYVETWHYIRCNPVAAGLVEHPDEWPWWWGREE